MTQEINQGTKKETQDLNLKDNEVKKQTQRLSQQNTNESNESPNEEKETKHSRSIAFLKRVLTEYMKIKPRTVTNLSKKEQAKAAKIIKKARMYEIIPYVRSTSNLEEVLQGKKNKSK